MQKKSFAILAATVFLGWGVQSASAVNLDISLSCPASVKVNTALNVTVKALNWDSSAITLSRYMTGIMANNSNTLGSAGLYGPFAKTLSVSKSIPKINTTTWVPGTVTPFSVPVTATAPNVPNKIAMVILNFITANGQELGGGSCMVNIIP